MTTIDTYKARRIAERAILVRFTRHGQSYTTDIRNCAAVFQGGNPCGTHRFWANGYRWAV